LKISIRHIIREAVKEVMGGVKLRKISINLKLPFWSDWYQKTFYPKDIVPITPIMSASNPKINEIFSDNQISDIGLYDYGDEYFSIICAEGVLKYSYSDHSDHTARCVSEDLYIDTMSDSDWELLKNKIKPVLEQKDVDHAIKEVGKLKRSLSLESNKKRDVPKHEEMRQMGFEIMSDVSIDKNMYNVVLSNGKYGLYNYDKKRMVIPLMFDYMSYLNKDVVKGIKGNDVVLFTINGIVSKVKEKYKIEDKFNEIVGEYLKKALQYGLSSIEREVKKNKDAGYREEFIDELETILKDGFKRKWANYIGTNIDYAEKNRNKIGPEARYWLDNYQKTIDNFNYKEAVDKILEPYLGSV